LVNCLVQEQNKIILMILKGEKFILNQIYNFQSFIHFTVHVKSGKIKIP
jgi:hypothetical protein